MNKTYKISFEIVSATNPNNWDWDMFLNLADDEEFYKLDIQEKASE